uniref:Uncharacterized protein n=1 Tax=Chromera velia CCMP2878 TaxID=1169474 RepID=A0A0G4H6Z5_9ALVE|eukprot:Cvel_24948.t1-p1 / transcript=Cvel_24948.t1 / gene=Cvel_24948 / organism=Chromera_velia_CCMP2878 / gene_product=hypothetical protein / transcript_product=hypothetical protein / location=Cvel_scaffold2761:15936-18315(-) / protein_length=499 / sequence_SO=supercontig / SO=protein_coding / is_pseudo=false
MDTPAEVGTSPKLKKHQVDRAEVPPSLSEHTPSVATSIDSAVGSPPLPLSAAGTAGCGALSLCTSHGAESAFQDLFPPLNQSGSSHSRADEGSQRDGERVETIFDGDDSNCSYTNSNSNGTPARSFSLLAEGEDILQDVFAFAEKSLLIGEKMEGGEFEGVENSKKRPELWQQEEQMEEHERESNGAPHTNSGCHQRVSSDSRTNELSGFGGRCVHTNQTHRGLPGHSHGVWDSPSCRTLSGGSHTPPPSNALVHSTQTTLGGDGCTGRTQKADVQLTCELCGTSASLTSSVAVRACSSSCARRVKEELERLRSDYAKLQERYTQALERSLLLSSDRNETLKMLVQQKQQSPEGKSPGASFEAEAEKEQEREAREGSEGHNHDGRLLNREDHSPPPGFEGTPCERPHNRHAHSSLRGMPLSPHHCRSSAPHLFNSRDREGNMFSSTDRDRDRDPRGFGYHEHNRTMGGGMRAPPSQFSPPPTETLWTSGETHRLISTPT